MIQRSSHQKDAPWSIKHSQPSLIKPACACAPKVMCAESKEYYDYKDMPPLPLTVSRIHIPKLGYTVVDKSSEEMREWMCMMQLR